MLNAFYYMSLAGIMFSACCYLDLTTLVYRKDHNESLLSPLYSFITRKVMKSEKWKDKKQVEQPDCRERL